MKALVTGAAGFIGSHVSKWLVNDGMSVVAVDDLSGGYLDNVPGDAKWVQASVTDYALLQSMFAAEHLCRRRSEPLHPAL
jgi:UDP-glucose 4-epimerase